MPKKLKKNYFGDEQEEMFIKYNEIIKELTSKTISEIDYKVLTNKKNLLFVKYLEKPIKIMCESILMRYFPVTRFDWGGHTKEELVSLAETHLIINMSTFNKKRVGKLGEQVKAYSYLQTIVKNYYIKIFKDIYKFKRISDKNYSFDLIANELDSQLSYNHIETEIYEDEDDTFIQTVIYSIKEKIDTDNSLTDNEIKAGQAIMYILDNWDSLFTENSINGKYDKKVSNKYTKEKTLFLISEYSGLSTKEFRKNMKIYGLFYDFIKNEFYK